MVFLQHLTYQCMLPLLESTAHGYISCDIICIAVYSIYYNKSDQNRLDR